MSPDAVRWEARYIQALLAQPAVSTVTLADGQPVPVEQIYVPRTLLHEVVQKKPDRESDRGAQDIEQDAGREREITVKLPVELWPKLRDERVVLVEGPAGMGKSTLTKQLVRESYTQHHLIPIWIPFRPFVASGLSIAEYLDQYYVPWLGLSDVRVPYHATGDGPDRSFGKWCYEQWQSGLGVLLFDGLDEVFRHDERVTALRGLPITGTGSTRPATILTSRPLSQSLPLQMAKVEVQGLTPPDQIRFMEKYQASLRLTDKQIDHFVSETKKREQGRLRELLTRPGHLIQILTTYATTNTLLDTETAILDQLLQSRLTITGRSDPPVQPAEPEKKHIVLAALALHLLACRQGQRHTRGQLLALIQQVLREHATHGTPPFPLAQASALLIDLTRNSALLTEVEPEVYEFETVIWLQHLTGTALANSNTIATLKLTDTQVLDFLDKKAWDPEWEPVLKSWVGTTPYPLPLFERLTDKKQDDLARHRLGIAGRCLLEVKQHVRDESERQWLDRHIPAEANEVWHVMVNKNIENLVAQSLRGLVAESKMPWEPQLIDEGGPVGRPAVKELDWLGAVCEAMPIEVQAGLLAQLTDGNPMERAGAASALGALGATMSLVVQSALIAQVTDANAFVRMKVVEALGLLRVVMPPAAQTALVARLEDDDSIVRLGAARALCELGRAMPATVYMALAACLTDEDRGVRWSVVKGLGDLGKVMPASAQAALVACLADEDSSLRVAAIETLGRLGRATSESVQAALVTCLSDTEWHVRSAAVMALGKLGGAMSTETLAGLVFQLTAGKGSVRWVRELKASKEMVMPTPVQEELVARLEDKHDMVRAAAVSALGVLEKEMPPVVQSALVARLADEESWVRVMAVTTLGRLAETMAAATLASLVTCVTDEDLWVRKASIDVLGEISEGIPASVRTALVARLADEELSVSRAAASSVMAFQQGGHRFFVMDGDTTGLMVSDLSATASFTDVCRSIPRGRCSTLVVS